jgi:5S rRNA maturation endonuclease (ribonuclease M5)
MLEKENMIRNERVTNNIFSIGKIDLSYNKESFTTIGTVIVQMYLHPTNCETIKETICGIKKVGKVDDCQFEFIKPPMNQIIYGKSRRLLCGSDPCELNWIIMVEGMDDIKNLDRAGYKNTIAIDGIRILFEEEINKDLEMFCKDFPDVKIVTFIDNDRNGDKIRKHIEEKRTIPIYKEAKFPDDCTVKEVEHLDLERIKEILEPIETCIKNEK